MSNVLLTTNGLKEEEFECEMDYFTEFINSLKTAHEKRYGTQIVSIVMAGIVGTWRGQFIGGKVQSMDYPLSMEVDSLEVVVEDDRSLLIKGIHHDGTHLMNLYLLTENQLKKANCYAAYQYGGWDSDDFKNIYLKCNPVKLPKNNNYYTV